MESAALAFYDGIVSRAVEARKKEVANAAKRKKVLDEDDFVAQLDSIIQRDFFPDLPRLRAQHELLEAIEAGDPERARKAYALVATPAATPAAGRSSRRPVRGSQWTPASVGGWEETPGRPAGEPSVPSVRSGTRKKLGSVSADDADSAPSGSGLDKFLSKHTSEDNASFSVILNKMHAEHRKKYWWAQDPSQGGPPLKALPAPEPVLMIEHRSQPLLDVSYDETSRAARALTAAGSGGDKDGCTTMTFAAPAAAETSRSIVPAQEPHRPWHKQGALVNDDRPSRLDFHDFTHKSSLYFVPDGQTPNEYPGPAPSLTANNTRFPVEKGAASGPSDGAEAAVAAANMSKEAAARKAMRGYALLDTPTPSLAPDESPMITWGEVLSTPVRIVDDESIGAYVEQPFKVPTLPPREQRLHRLAADAGKRLRQRTPQSASPRGAARVRPSSGAASGVSPLLAASPKLSEAGRKLAKTIATKLTPGLNGGLNSELRASYGVSARATPRPSPRPSPRTTPGAKGTPRIGSASGSVPGSAAAPKRKREHTPTQRRAKLDGPQPVPSGSVTDGLLNI